MRTFLILYAGSYKSFPSVRPMAPGSVRKPNRSTQQQCRLSTVRRQDWRYAWSVLRTTLQWLRTIFFQPPVAVHRDRLSLLRPASARKSLAVHSAYVVWVHGKRRSSPISVFYNLWLSPPFQQKQGRLRADAILVTREVQRAGSLRVRRVNVYGPTTSGENERHEGPVPVLASKDEEGVAVRVPSDELFCISGAENGAHLCQAR